MILGILFILLSGILVFALPRVMRPSFALSWMMRLALTGAAMWMPWDLWGFAGGDDYAFFQRSVALADRPLWDWFVESGNWLSSGTSLFVLLHAVPQSLAGGGGVIAAHGLSLLIGTFASVVLCWCWLELAPGYAREGRILPVLYVLSPSTLVYQGLVLREGLQSALLLLLLYAAIRSWRRGWGPAAVLSFSLSGLGLVFLHHSFLLVVPLVMGIFLVASVGGVRAMLRRDSSILLVTLGLVGLAGLVAILAQGGRYFGDAADGGLVENAAYFNSRTLATRATYRSGSLSVTDPLEIATAFAEYELEPLPSRWGGAADLVLFAENIYRLILIPLYLRSRRRLVPGMRPMCDGIVVAWLVLELFWSIGTVNWGTAARHHVPGFSLAIILGVLGWSLSWGKRNQRKRVVPRPAMRS